MQDAFPSCRKGQADTTSPASLAATFWVRPRVCPPGAPRATPGTEGRLPRTQPVLLFPRTRPGPPLWAAMGTPRRPSRQQGRFPGLAAPRRGGGLTRKAERCWGRTILGTETESTPPALPSDDFVSHLVPHHKSLSSETSLGGSCCLQLSPDRFSILESSPSRTPGTPGSPKGTPPPLAAVADRTLWSN